MSHPTLPGTTLVYADEIELAHAAARQLAAALESTVARQGYATFALSGGGTPQPAYAALAKIGTVPWDKITVAFIDERAVPPTHDRSNYGAARKSLLAAVEPRGARVLRMRGEASDLEAAADEYGRTLAEITRTESGAPVLDVAVVGIGEDGHTASLFPGSPLLRERSRWAVAVPSADEREARLTVTVPVLHAIRECFSLVVGTAKGPPLRAIAAKSDKVEEIPARLYHRSTGRLVWMLDADAAWNAGLR